MNNATRALAIALASLAAAALPAIAQQAERPVVKPGDRWLFVEYYIVPSTEANREWVIQSVSDSRIEGTENDDPLSMTPELNVLESPRTRNSNPKALGFPLEIGKKWQYEDEWVFKVTSSSGTLVADVEVVGYEKVKVVAGSFDAFRLVKRSRLYGTTAGKRVINALEESIYWYAPAARAIVKSVTHTPTIGVVTVELVKFDPRP